MVHLWRQKGWRECRCSSYGGRVVRSHIRPITAQTLSGSRSDEGLHAAAAGVSIDFPWSRLMQYAAQRRRALWSCLTQQQRCSSAFLLLFFGTSRLHRVPLFSVRCSLIRLFLRNAEAPFHPRALCPRIASFIFFTISTSCSFAFSSNPGVNLEIISRFVQSCGCISSSFSIA